MTNQLNWLARKDDEEDWFPAAVPGNVQQDYAVFCGFEDVHYADNYKQFLPLEPSTWQYRAEFAYAERTGQRLFFVSKGIDYLFDIQLNGQLIHKQEGMFTPVELDLTPLAQAHNVLLVTIHPHPKRAGAVKDDRMEASASCKPAVCYGWDWHPRLLSSGIWDDTYLEWRQWDYIADCEVSYTLDDSMETAQVHVAYDCETTPLIEFFDNQGNCLYRGTEQTFSIHNVNLWWCNGQGEATLYHWIVSTDSCKRQGKTGFRRVRLVMNEGGWDNPRTLPMSRSNPPITLELNGRRIFAKGTNWVHPELFPGTITEDTYRPLIDLAVKANMNIFRSWGGGIINKDSFFEQCDEAGMMVWQEFPLACNNYDDDAHYLPVLEQEATSIVKRLRSHACLVLWCGGNELFNSWSCMTDQSLALRLLNKVCYQHNAELPFLMTSPVMGMAHGAYTFYNPETDCDVFQAMQRHDNTAYTEFGVPSLADVDYLRTFIPPDQWFPMEFGSAWESHHALNAFRETRWACQDVVEQYFGPVDSMEQLQEYTTLLQCEGYKGIFEEARRQKGACSMAINWCYNEPWKTAANNSIISYPARPKRAYAAVAQALRPILASARMPKFSWTEGECFTAQLWLLNDAPYDTSDTISAWIDVDGISTHVMDWNTGQIGANQNKMGHTLSVPLPAMESDTFTLRLESANGFGSSYTLCFQPKIRKAKTRQMNQTQA